MYMNKNIVNTSLKVCSLKPLTGYLRDGYCKPYKNDLGKHLVCAKMNKKFLDFTQTRKNNLRSVVKEGDKWCICEDVYFDSHIHNKEPNIIKNATHKNTKPHIKNAIMKQKGGRITRKNRNKKRQFLYHPNNPDKSFDVYIDKNPKDTIPIKYTTVKDVENTIKKLEKLYKSNKYPHKRIWQVGMILKVRLEAMKKNKKKMYPNAKNISKRYYLSKKYFNFLKKRTKTQKNRRKKLIFKPYSV